MDPSVRATDDGAASPLDRALALLLAGERDAALRWSAALVARPPLSASALVLTSLLLAQAGDRESASRGLTLGVTLAIDTGNLPLAVFAALELGTLGKDASPHLDAIARAFSYGSPRISGGRTLPPPPLPSDVPFEPLDSALTGPALTAEAGELVEAACGRHVESAAGEPPLAPLALFSALDFDALRALLGAFEPLMVAERTAVITQGEDGNEAYVVARGELEVRHIEEPHEHTTLARLTNGAVFGEMALLSRAPRTASVVAKRPSLLLVARRDKLEAVATECPAVGSELAAHCRRRLVANLVRTSNVLRAVPEFERPLLVERFETRVFERGDSLIAYGDEPRGLHLIASGEVAVLGREPDGESVHLGTLTVGETVGEVALVLRRNASADVVATIPTVTLHLPTEKFLGIIHDHPAICAGLYLCAVERDAATERAAQTSTVALVDDYDLV